MISAEHLHPMLVHFPIALIVFGFIAELVFRIFIKETWLLNTGFYLLIIGTLSALAAYLTGEFFTSEMSGSAAEVKEMHELFASITLWTMIANAVFRIILKIIKKEDKKLIWISFTVYCISAISVSITGLYGGTLVYNYMMPL